MNMPLSNQCFQACAFCRRKSGLLNIRVDLNHANRFNTRLRSKTVSLAFDPNSCSGQVAQLVEQRIENPRVGSSILPLATISLFTRSFA